MDFCSGGCKMSVPGIISASAKAAVYCVAGLLSCEGRTDREREGEREREGWQLLIQGLSHCLSRRLTVTSGNEALWLKMHPILVSFNWFSSSCTTQNISILNPPPLYQHPYPSPWCWPGGITSLSLLPRFFLYLPRLLWQRKTSAGKGCFHHSCAAPLCSFQHCLLSFQQQ